MNRYVADTHALHWYLGLASELSAAARAVFREAEHGEAVIHVPTIVMAELYYLLRKKGRAATFDAIAADVASSPLSEIVPLVLEDVLGMHSLPAALEMHDRLIICVARRMDAPVVTKDRMITESRAVPTIW